MGGCQMRWLAKVILLLGFICFSASAYSTYIEHPWEYYYWKSNSPSMGYLSDEWIWQPYAIDNTLTLLRLDNITAQMDPEETELIYGARDARVNATELKAKCIDEIEFAEKIATMNGWSEYANTIGFWTSGGMTFGPIVGAASFIYTVHTVLSDYAQHQEDYIQFCSGYGDAWAGTMEKSMDALASSMDKVDREYSALTSEFYSLNRTGLCDQDYTGAGHEECLKVQTAIGVMDSGSIEGSYGTYNTVKNNLGFIRDELKKNFSNTALFSDTMNTIWKTDGVIEMLKGLRMKANSSRTSAEAAYDKVLWNATTKKSRVNEAIGLLEKQELQLIKSAPIIQGEVGASETGTIAERYAQSLERTSRANDMYSSASAIHAERTRVGYLKESVGNMAGADFEFGSLELALSLLKSDAEKVTSDQKQTASGKIAEVKSLISSAPASPFILEKVREAEKYFSDGQAAILLGRQYNYYSMAAASAREAITKYNMQSYNESIELEALKAELGTMIQNAKKDGIETFAQQQVLDDLKEEDFLWVKEQLVNAENEIVESARIKYGWLEDKREELLKKIRLTGGEADDQLTTMANAERGIVDSGGRIDYRKGLGRLKALADTYASVEKTLDGYIEEIVAHSTMVEPEVYMDEVALDEPTDITIDLLVINTNVYETENVALNVELPVSVDLMYSDITAGADMVSSVLMTGADRVTIYMKKVDPFAKHRITFETEKIIAHTTKASRKAIGLGGGSASIDEQIDFVLDSDVNSLAIPAGMKNVMIDGLAPGRPLKKGSHMLSSEYVMEDAYNESIGNLKTASLGLNSQVDYDVLIDPSIDLDSVTVFIDPNAKISNLNVIAMAGGSTGNQKKIAEGRYSYEVLDLIAGKQALVKVSYILENASGYVASELGILEHGNYSANVKGLVAEARAAFDSGDVNVALAKIQQANALIKSEAAETEKTLRKIDALKSDIQAEIDEIEDVLASAKGSNSPFVAKLSARASDLRKRILDSSAKEPGDALRELEEVDLKWKGSEIKSLRKEVFDEYNKLKLRFAEAGNTSTPIEFLDLEDALNLLDATNRLGDAVMLIGSAEKAKAAVAAQEKEATQWRDSVKQYFENLSEGVRANLKKYVAEATAAKGTEFSPLFTYTEKEVESKITELEKLIKAADPKLVQSKMDALNKTDQTLADTINLLRNQANSKLELVERLYNESAAGMGQTEQSAIEQKIVNLKGLVSSGQFINALRAAGKILDDISQAKGGGTSSLLLLGITAMAILAVVAVYVFKQNEGRKKEGKILKKLEKTDEEPETKPGAGLTERDDFEGRDTATQQ